MASCFFLLNQFDDVLVYLDSVKVRGGPPRRPRHPRWLTPRAPAQTYFYNDDTFNYNYGQALAAVGRWKEAEEALQLVQSDALKADYAYLSWTARCCAAAGERLGGG